MKALYKKLLVVAAVGMLMAVSIHVTQEFRFYNIESNDLFLYDWSDIWARLCQTGGSATVLASFLTQFFRIPFVGPLIVTCIYLSVWGLVRAILHRSKGGGLIDGFALLPSVFLFLCMENDYYRFQGHIAFILAMLALLAYVSIPKERARARTVAGVVLIPVLYHAAGSIAVLFVASAMLWEIMERGVRGLCSLVYPAILLPTAYLYLDLSKVSDWEHALTPFMYYDWPSTYFFPLYAWAMVPILMVSSWGISCIGMKPSTGKWLFASGLAISFFIAGNLYSQVHSRNYYRLIQEQYWAENEDWDMIIKTADRRQPTFLVSYLNLALAHKGLLVQNYMCYNPQSLSSLMYPTPNLKTGLSLQSAVYHAWDYHAAARQAAFDANVVTSGNRNPRQLQVMIRTNQALGACDVAEKYISILEKTLFYRRQAAELRDNMTCVTSGIMSLPDQHVRYDGIEGDMRDILAVNPSHAILTQFYQLYQILEKEGAR